MFAVSILKSINLLSQGNVAQEKYHQNYVMVFLNYINLFLNLINMKLEGAIIKEQGQKFAIIIVKSHVLNSTERDDAAQQFSEYFPGMPIILMAQNSRGIPTYYGRKDIVAFLSNLHISQIPWKKYTF